MSHGSVTSSFLAELTKLTAPERVFSQNNPSHAEVIRIHSSDESRFPEHPPEAVVFPLTTQEVAKIAQLCSSHCIALTTRGGPVCPCAARGSEIRVGPVLGPAWINVRS